MKMYCHPCCDKQHEQHTLYREFSTKMTLKVVFHLLSNWIFQKRFVMISTQIHRGSETLTHTVLHYFIITSLRTREILLLQRRIQTTKFEKCTLLSVKKFSRNPATFSSRRKRLNILLPTELYIKHWIALSTGFQSLSSGYVLG